MNSEQLTAATAIQQTISELKHDLAIVDDFLANAESGATMRVKVNTRWIFDIPVNALKGHVQARKAQLEQELRQREVELLAL